MLGVRRRPAPRAHVGDPQGGRAGVRTAYAGAVPLCDRFCTPKLAGASYTGPGDTCEGVGRYELQIVSAGACCPRGRGFGGGSCKQSPRTCPTLRLTCSFERRSLEPDTRFDVPKVYCGFVNLFDSVCGVQRRVIQLEPYSRRAVGRGGRPLSGKRRAHSSTHDAGSHPHAGERIEAHAARRGGRPT